MAMCEKCWADAGLISALSNRPQHERMKPTVHYRSPYGNGWLLARYTAADRLEDVIAAFRGYQISFFVEWHAQ